MAVEILINVRPNQTRVACIEDKNLVDLKVERRTSLTLVGSIFKGRVVKVLPGMQAAFVDIGLPRAAFLYVGDVRSSDIQPEKSLYVEGEEDDLLPEVLTEPESPEIIATETKALIQDLLKQGQEIMVQVSKDPLGSKGCRVTSHISLPGRYSVYIPKLEHFGISRRIEDLKERARLEELVKKIQVKGGVIIRTAGEGIKEKELKDDLFYLKKVWKEVQKNYVKKKSSGVVYKELDVELRALRDMLSEDVERVVIDNQSTYKKIVSFVLAYIPSFKKKVHLYKESQPLFDIYDIDLEITRSLQRKIWLKSGGYIVIDEAEALVAIDINTGRYVGKRDLEETILNTNMESVKEIAHQLRIRNCGGIIIIDFIDMQKKANREKVLSLLSAELKKDRSKTLVVSMSDLGLVQMTRKRMRPSLISKLCHPCPYCEGRGYVKTRMTVANEIFRALEREVSSSQKGTLFVHCHSDIADWVYDSDSDTFEIVEKKLKQNVVFKVEPSFHVEEFEIYNASES